MEATIDLTEHQKEYASLYAHGVLHAARHYRLVKDLAALSEQAGVNPKYVYTSMAKICSPGEISWVRDLHKHHKAGIAGMAYIGAHHVEDRMMAVAGACMRNFVDARVITAQEAIHKAQDGDPSMNSVLLIPNFLVGGLPKWQISILTGLLYARFLKGLQTLVSAESMTLLGKEYGSSLQAHLNEHYEQVS